MSTPAARIRFSIETIAESVVIPQIKFSRGDDGKKVVLRITLGLDKIGYIVEDTSTGGDKLIERDAILKEDFFVPKKVTVAFSQDGTSGTLMTITANLPTKVPGGGSWLTEDQEEQK